MLFGGRKRCYPEKPVSGLSNIGRGRDGAILDAPHSVTIRRKPPVRINSERRGSATSNKLANAVPNTKMDRVLIRTTTALPHIFRRTVITRLLPGD